MSHSAQSLVHSVALPLAGGTGKVCDHYRREPTITANCYDIGFANDPYLAGIMVADTVEGMQSTGAVASTKVGHP